MENFKSVMQDFSQNPQAYLKTIILPLSLVFFLSIATWGRKFWMKATSVLLLLNGATCLLFPGNLSRLWAEGVFDELHLQELRCIGILMLTQALTHLLVRKSNDPTVESSLLWSRTLFLGSLMVLNINGFLTYNENKTKMKDWVLQAALLNTTWFFGASLFYCLWTSDWGGYTEVTTLKRNTHLRIDFALWLCHGMMAFVLPEIQCQFQTKLTKLDSLHTYMAQVMGAGFVASSVASGRASNFLKEDDKRSVLLSHAAANLMFFLTMVLCQLLTNVFSMWHAYYGMTCVLALAVNDILGSNPTRLKREIMDLIQTLIPPKRS